MNEEYLLKNGKFKLKSLKNNVVFIVNEIKEKSRFGKLKIFLIVISSIFLTANYIVTSFVDYI